MKINKEKFLEKYRGGMVDKELSKHFECSLSMVSQIRKVLNLNSNNRIFKKYSYEDIINMYNIYLKDGINEVNKKYNTNITSTFFKRKGLKVKTKEEYFTLKKIKTYKKFNLQFKKINSIEEAYILGLIIADGNLRKDKNNINIGLHKQDKYLLDKLGSIIGNTTISIVNNMSILNIYSSILWENLNNLGVLERKSFKDFHVPKMEDRYFSHFLRGYFDGDGHFALNNKKISNSNFGFTGTSYTFLNDIKNFLITKGIIIKLDIARNIGDNVNILGKNTFVKTKIYTLRTTNIQNNILLYEFLYKNKKDLYMHRKFEKASIYYNYYK